MHQAAYGNWGDASIKEIAPQLAAKLPAPSWYKGDKLALSFVIQATILEDGGGKEGAGA